MKTWNEEQIVNLARRAYEKRLQEHGDYALTEFMEGCCAVLKEVLSISYPEAERRLLKGHENLKEPKS